MLLGPGAELINAQGATIAGYPAAVYSQTGGSAGTVLNAGLLTSGSTVQGHNGGVALLSGGYVSNASTGTITGGGVGVVIYNYANTLINGGSVVNRGSIGGLGTHANGVELDSGGFVSNAAGGTITATNHGVEIDVASADQTATVVNQGVIIGGSTGNSGIYLQGGGSVTNTGTGSVIGGQQGVLFGVSGSAGGVLLNSGYIAATGTGVGVEFFSPACSPTRAPSTRPAPPAPRCPSRRAMPTG